MCCKSFIHCVSLRFVFFVISLSLIKLYHHFGDLSTVF
nr:MAG TPA: hypothetical protein [Caudoviricetes sp.]